MQGENINNWVVERLQRIKALKALEKAKALEAIQLKKGKKYVQIDDKTKVLK